MFPTQVFEPYLVTTAPGIEPYLITTVLGIEPYLISTGSIPGAVSESVNSGISSREFDRHPNRQYIWLAP